MISVLMEASQPADAYVATTDIEGGFCNKSFVQDKHSTPIYSSGIFLATPGYQNDLAASRHLPTPQETNQPPPTIHQCLSWVK